MLGDFHQHSSEWQKQARLKHHDDRFHQLNDLLNAYVGGTWTYLLAVNGGAAAGTLAFIGAKESIAKMGWPYGALALFVAGLICIGFGHAFMVHKAQLLIDKWNSNMELYWKNELQWNIAMVRDEELVKKWAWVPWILGWSALTFFLFGVSLAAWNFRDVALSAAAVTT